MSTHYTTRDGTVTVVLNDKTLKVCTCCERTLPMEEFGLREMPTQDGVVVIRCQPQCHLCRGLATEDRRALRRILMGGEL